MPPSFPFFLPFLFEDFFLLSVNIKKIIYKRFFFRFSFSDNVNSNNNGKYFLSFFVLLESKAKGCDGGKRKKREVSAFMVYHESVKHIIPLYEAFGRERDGEKKNQQLHIIKECQMCHTQFSVAARQKSTFICLGEREKPREKKSIFHRRQNENKKTFFFPYEAHFVPSASVISFDLSSKKKAKKKRHQNEIFYVEDIL